MPLSEISFPAFQGIDQRLPFSAEVRSEPELEPYCR